MKPIRNFKALLKYLDEYPTVYNEIDDVNDELKKWISATYSSDDVQVGHFIWKWSVGSFFDEMPDSLLVESHSSIIVPR